MRLSKLESLVLCTLRLAYHEQMQQVSEDLRCELTVGALRERLIHSGKPAAQLSRRALEHALRRLARHSLVVDRPRLLRRGHRDVRGEPAHREGAAAGPHRRDGGAHPRLYGRRAAAPNGGPAEEAEDGEEAG